MAKKGDVGRIWDYIVNTQVWRSIMRHGYPDTPRNRSLAIMSNVFLHLHPIRLRKSGLRVRYTWCMGGLTFFLFLVETITGLLLMFYYRPTAEYAYHDIVYLRADVALGTMREIHRWGAHAMVITIWLHMMRVFLTGAYKPPREFNWGVGVVLLVITLLLSFTSWRCGRSRWGRTWRGRPRFWVMRVRAPRSSRSATSAWCTWPATSGSAFWPDGSWGRRRSCGSTCCTAWGSR
jgi:hypothetical protein